MFKSLLKQHSYEHHLSDLIQIVRMHSQRFDNCAQLCSYEAIVHTNDTVRSQYRESQDSHKEILGQMNRLEIESFKQNNMLGNIVTTEAGNIQQMMGMMANRLNAMSENMIKEVKETIVKEALEKFLSSSNLIDYRTQDGQTWLHFSVLPY